MVHLDAVWVGFIGHDQSSVSHFHFYENLVAANLGMRFALWQLRAATRNSKELFCYDCLNSAHKDGEVNVDVVVNIL